MKKKVEPELPMCIDCEKRDKRVVHSIKRRVTKEHWVEISFFEHASDAGIYEWKVCPRCAMKRLLELAADIKKHSTSKNYNDTRPSFTEDHTERRFK